MELAKPFNVLEPYPIRIFIFKNQYTLQSTLEIIQKNNGLEERIPIHKEELVVNQRLKNFSYIEISEYRMYTFMVKDPKFGDRVVRDIFDLVATKNVSPITYIHSSVRISGANPDIRRVSRLNNFLPILFHSQDEVEQYFSSGLMFRDEKEILYYLSQKQTYNKTKLTTGKTFSEKNRKKSKKDKRNDNSNGKGSNLDLKNIDPKLAELLLKALITK